MTIERCAEITINAGAILLDFTQELAKGVTPKRAKEIDRDTKLVKLILKYIWMPHADTLRELTDEDTLEGLGL